MNPLPITPTDLVREMYARLHLKPIRRRFSAPGGACLLMAISLFSGNAGYMSDPDLTSFERLGIIHGWDGRQRRTFNLPALQDEYDRGYNVAAALAADLFGGGAKR